MKSKKGRGINPPPAEAPSNDTQAEVRISKTHMQSNTVVLYMALEDAVWEILRYGGWDKSQSCSKLVNAIHEDLLKGFASATNFYTYKLHSSPSGNTKPLPTAIGGKRLAVLTPEENKHWEQSFAFHVEDGKTDEEASTITWLEMQDLFPRLKSF